MTLHRIVALIHQTGLPATLERLGLPRDDDPRPAVVASVVAPCRIRDAAPARAIEPTQQTRRRALLAAEDLTAAGYPSPPIVGDRLSVFGKRFTVLAVEPQMLGGDPMAFSLTLQG